jgi:hypothetical protein
MKVPTDAQARHEASIEIGAEPEAVYDLVSDVCRMGEWSPENLGADWVDGGTGKLGDWFDRHNKVGEREWTRACEVARADRGIDFTFVVGGVEENCTWWSYEMEAINTGTRLTERWWLVNKTPGVQAMTPEEFQQRASYVETMLIETVAAIKVVAES